MSGRFHHSFICMKRHKLQW